jgi:hypothetical protein
MGQTLRRTGPYSRSAELAKPKRRTRESRFLFQIRAGLMKHLGGTPNIAQMLMIERIAMTLLRIELMDREALESDTPGVITERQSRDYLAWVNTVGRLLRSLGLDGAPEPRETVLQSLQREGTTQPSSPTPTAAHGRPMPPKMLPRMYQP